MRLDSVGSIRTQPNSNQELPLSFRLGSSLGDIGRKPNWRAEASLALGQGGANNLPPKKHFCYEVVPMEKNLRKFCIDLSRGFCQECSRFGWRIVFFSGIPHPHLLGEPLPESPFYPFLKGTIGSFALIKTTLRQKGFTKSRFVSRTTCIPEGATNDWLLRQPAPFSWS